YDFVIDIGSFNQFVSYMSAIFDAEDAITSESLLSNDQLSLLIPSSIGSNEPLLTSEVIHQIIKLVNKVCRFNRLEDADVDDLGRLLKILERSVREVETLDLFPRDYMASSKSNSRSQNKVSDSMSVDDDSMDEDDKCIDSHLRKVEEKINKIINGIEAATAAFIIMTGGNLSKQRQTAGMLQIITNYLRKLYDLMQKEELSDSIVITVSYIAIGPFFVDSVNNSGNSIFGNGLEAVKLVALGLLRSIWIAYILPYRLPDGKSIQMVSALILQLIQSCAVGITHFGLKSVDDQQSEQLVENLTNGVPNDLKKSIKNSNESEYRVLLDNFMEDVITVLNYPEWPAAEMIIGYINDKKADNYTKSMAIDYLGIIAGRIKKFANTGLISGEGVSEDNGEDNDDNDNQNWIDKIKDIPRGDQTDLRWGDKDDASLASITKLMNKIVAEYWQMSSENQIVQTLGQVVVCDPGILSQVNVRQTIAQRFSDNSPAVRDAAIELVGRYLAQKPEITEQYYKDTGLNVRKRVIKLLRDIYLKSSDQEMKIDIGCKILIRVNDDDDHVKDLALKTIQELWFAPFKHQKNFYAETYDLDDDDKGQNEFNNMPASGKKDVLARSLLIVGVAGRLGERNGHIMEQKQLEAGKELSSARNVMVLLLIVGLLCKNFDFDKKRLEKPESTDLMDRILNTGVMDMKIQLMKVFLDFLVSEQQKINTDLEDKNLKVLIGNADEFAEAGPEALLNPMYSLLKDKRKSRNDFLVSIVKTFDFDLKKCDESKVDVGFCKFVAENLATIDYKSIEEVLHVIYLINRVLSVVAISVLHSVQNNIQETIVDNV
ncbi:13444_t:CDS:10, partial [Racocetra fulgida]